MRNLPAALMRHHPIRDLAIAAALTITMVAMLFLLAGMTRFTEAPGEMLVMAFTHALPPTLPPPTTRPPAARRGPATSTPARMAIDPALLGDQAPSVSPSTERREWAYSRTRSTSALSAAELPRERRTASTSRRSIIPRTRTNPQPSGRVVLDAALPLQALRPPTPPPSIPRMALRPEALERPAADTAPVDIFGSGGLDPAAVLSWMAARPGDIPPALLRHMDYSPGALTSLDTLTYQGADHELYLMGRPATRELHIVMVRGGRSYYLIDRGARREGHKFRLGALRREGGVISGIVSEDMPLDSPSAQRMYSSLLSWWITVDDQHN